MIKALAIKELREVLGIALFGLVGHLVMVAALVGMKPFADWLPLARIGVPFHSGVISPPFGGIGALFTIALALRQSAWEGAFGTYKFLLHRPIRRETVFLTKMAVGIGVYLLCTLVPLLLYAGWAAVPGHYPGPFEWSMTGYAWRLIALMPMIYLGAFLSGLRPGRWYGTRLMPLLASALVVIVIPAYQLSWFLALSIALLWYGMLIAGVLHVALERDYA